MNKCITCGNYHLIRPIPIEEFEAEIAEGTSLVYFCCSSMPNCSQCRTMTTIIAPLTNEHKVLKLDIVNHQKFAAKFHILVTPALAVFANGKQVQTFHSPQSTKQLDEILKRWEKSIR